MKYVLSFASRRSDGGENGFCCARLHRVTIFKSDSNCGSASAMRAEMYTWCRFAVGVKCCRRYIITEVFGNYP
jgi:hypothetical protein